MGERGGGYNVEKVCGEGGESDQSIIESDGRDDMGPRNVDVGKGAGIVHGEPISPQRRQKQGWWRGACRGRVSYVRDDQRCGADSRGIAGGLRGGSDRE